MPPETLTIDDIVTRLRQEESRPKPGSEAVVRFGQDGAYEVVRDPAEWWASFSQHKPGVDHIIDITEEGPQLIERSAALERLQSYEFGQVRAVLRPVEQPLNDAFRQFPYLGSVLVGGIPAVLTSEAIDGFAPPQNADGTTNWVNPLTKAVFAVGVPLTVGNMLMSRTGQIVYASVLGVSALLGISQIDRGLKNIVIWFRNLFRDESNKIPFEQHSRALGGGRERVALNPGSWVTAGAAGGDTHSHSQISPGRGGPGRDPIAGAFGR